MSTQAQYGSFNWLDEMYSLSQLTYRLFVINATAAFNIAAAFSKSENDKVLIRLYLDHLLSAANPAYNFLNPEFWKRIKETEGESFTLGLFQMWSDIVRNGGMPSVSNNANFRVGVNLGTTPHAVVYEDSHMRLVRYDTTTDTVYPEPLVIVPPMINGPEILDLQKGQSFVEFMVNKGHVLYEIQWKPATAEMADTSFVDYLDLIIKAIDFIGVPKVNTIGLCMGGYKLALANAYLAKAGRDVINTQSTIVTMLDYPDGGTGAAGAMISKPMIEFLKLKIRQNGGIMKGEDIASSFANLLPEALIYKALFDYWLLGKELPENALMAWNALTVTDIPGKAYLGYLQSAFLNNEFARGEFWTHGVKLSVYDSPVPRFAVSGAKDHIVPSDTALSSASMTNDVVWLAEDTGGHVGAIAKKANNKRNKHRLLKGKFEGRAAFERDAELVNGSWYETYDEFLREYSSERVPVASINF